MMSDLKNSAPLKANLHTHTLYCDGESSVEELIRSAIDDNFDVLGFSGHSYTSFDNFGMDPETASAYRGEVRRLGEKYEDRIRIFCGIEQDILSDASAGDADYDYVIGSVHTVAKEYNGQMRYISVDSDMNDLKKAVNEYYGGDFVSLAEDYFSMVSSVAETTGCQIIGHFDLITKFIERDPFFNVNDPRYEAAADKALGKLLKSGAIFEINTGAMARGYRTAPYPSADILQKIKDAGGRITISSDCHSAGKLDYAFSGAYALALKCGFSSVWIMNRDGQWVEQDLLSSSRYFI